MTPLHAVPLEMGPLEFSAGSHQIVEGRDLKISDESEVAIQQRLRVTDYPHIIESFDPGEVSFHFGWILHSAGANTTKDVRKLMTVNYMDEEMKLKHLRTRTRSTTGIPGALGQLLGKSSILS